LSWLRTQTEFIKQVVREAPRDVVVLPTEQLDGAQSPATEMKTPGSQTDRDTLPREDLELDVDLDEIDIPVARAPTTETLGGGPSGPVEDPLHAERRPCPRLPRGGLHRNPLHNVVALSRTVDFQNQTP
jgi:hypothetical protein